MSTNEKLLQQQIQQHKLQQQILLEMQEEAKIDKKIESFQRGFWKERENRNYKIVSKEKTFHAFLLFDRRNLHTCICIFFVYRRWKEKFGHTQR